MEEEQLPDPRDPTSGYKETAEKGWGRDASRGLGTCTTARVPPPRTPPPPLPPLTTKVAAAERRDEGGEVGSLGQGPAGRLEARAKPTLISPSRCEHLACAEMPLGG